MPSIGLTTVACGAESQAEAHSSVDRHREDPIPTYHLRMAFAQLRTVTYPPQASRSS